MKILAVLLICLVNGLYGCSSNEDVLSAQELEEQYLSALDNWVSDGGNINTIQSIVVGYCGKLVMITVDSEERVALSTTDRDEFYFRVDVCTKLTVNRVYPQPEFEKLETIKTICDKNSAAIFQKLSENRAKSVVEYLLDKGVANDRLAFKGYGFTQPVAPNDTEEGRQQNRRTEFKIMGK